MSIYVIARGSKRDGTREYFGLAGWTPDLRIASRYTGRLPNACEAGERWVKLRVTRALTHSEFTTNLVNRCLAAEKERDALKTRVGELEDLLAICDGLDAMIIPKRDRAQAAEAKLAEATTERDALRAKLDVETRNVSGLASSLTLVRQECSDAIRERDEAIVRAKAAEKAFLDVADEFGLHIRATAAEKALGQLAEMTRERDAAVAKSRNTEADRDGWKAETATLEGKLADAIRERDAAKALEEELATKYELRCNERAALWDRATIAERDLAALRSRVIVAESTLVVCKMDLATAIRERDAAVSEGDQQRERAKRAEALIDTGCCSTLNALARATLAESRLAEIAALVGGGK